MGSGRPLIYLGARETPKRTIQNHPTITPQSPHNQRKESVFRKNPTPRATASRCYHPNWRTGTGYLDRLAGDRSSGSVRKHEYLRADRRRIQPSEKRAPPSCPHDDRGGPWGRRVGGFSRREYRPKVPLSERTDASPPLRKGETRPFQRFDDSTPKRPPLLEEGTTGGSVQTQRATSPKSPPS